MGTKRLTYCNFIDKVVEEVKSKIGEQKQVRVSPVKKNNGLTLDGMIILDKGINISPTIYINSYYDKYRDGDSIEDIVDKIISTYEEHRPTEDFDIETFRNFDIAKQTLIMKVVNTKRNEKLLKTIPHRDFENLSIVYMVLVTSFENEFATILIHNENMKMWQVTEEELYEAAMKNTPALLPYTFNTLVDILKNMVGTFDFPLIDNKMYMLSNNKKIYGATAMIYDGLLKEIKEQLEDNFYLIPSSVNEVLIIPEKEIKEEYTWDRIRHLLFDEMSADAELGEHFDFTDLPLEKCVDKEKFVIKNMNKMIEEVNNEHVSVEEILDDYVYFFDGEKLTCKK